jgi:hypothetical protein
MGAAFTRAAPILIMCLSVVAAINYIPVGDWRRVVYWAAAAAITWSVTF